MSKLHEIFRVCCLWPRFGPSLAVFDMLRTFRYESFITVTVFIDNGQAQVMQRGRAVKVTRFAPSILNLSSP